MEPKKRKSYEQRLYESLEGFVGMDVNEAKELIKRTIQEELKKMRDEGELIEYYNETEEYFFYLPKRLVSNAPFISEDVCLN